VSVGADGALAAASGPEVHAAAGLARWSSHPLAQALSMAPQVLAAPTPDDPAPSWRQVQEVPGSGLQAEDGHGRLWRLGSAAWVGGRAELDRASPIWPAVFFGPVEVGDGGCGAVLRFDFDERLRDGAAEAVAALRRDGIELSLLSGDDPERVARVSARLGLSGPQGGASPEDKLVALSRAQAGGTLVGMVGDGVNDAPVLARADVSFAMGQGALVSRLNADAVIVSNRLADLVLARQLARRTMAVVRQNLVWALVYNGACIPLALMGYLPPWAAGLGMACSSLVVVGNSLRLSRVRPA